MPDCSHRIYVRKKYAAEIEKIKQAGERVRMRRVNKIMLKYKCRFLFAKVYKKFRRLLSRLQNKIRMHTLRSYFLRLRKAAIVIQRNVRTYLIRRKIRTQRLQEYLTEVNLDSLIQKDQ